ncbi:MAG: hypothetical protein KAU20_02365 [Nanoarchaeota archaeon]|nr:hypothetical protein [Nanoarchaeota archaeon]
MESPEKYFIYLQKGSELNIKAEKKKDIKQQLSDAAQYIDKLEIKVKQQDQQLLQDYLLIVQLTKKYKELKAIKWQFHN